MVLYSVLLIFIIILLFTIYNKVSYIKIRTNSKKVRATVIEYRKEKSPSRNDYTLLNYPYVKIDLDTGEYIIQKLRYADNYSFPFIIGQQIHVFWDGDKLLYWNAYDRGIYKYLPEKLSLR